MAQAVKEKKKPPVEAFDNESHPIQGAISQKSGGIKRMFIMLLGLQLLMAGGAFAFVKFYLAPKVQYAVENPGEFGTAAKIRGEIHLIENIIVNPAGTDGARFLSASVAVETAKIAGGPEGENGSFAMISPVIRDALITILSSKTMEELSSVESKTLLRDEILTVLNRAVSPDSIYSVYFVDYALR